MRANAFYLSLLCLAFVAGGCDQPADQRVPVAGTVLIDGRPLTSGTIRFVPALGRPASSAIMSDGSFELASDSVNRVSEAGVVPGKYRIQVSASTIVDDDTIRWNAPEKYANFRTSGLDVTIDEPIDDMVIELTWGEAKAAEASDAPIDVDGSSNRQKADEQAPAVSTPTSESDGAR